MIGIGGGVGVCIWNWLINFGRFYVIMDSIPGGYDFFMSLNYNLNQKVQNVSLRVEDHKQSLFLRV